MDDIGFRTWGPQGMVGDVNRVVVDDDGERRYGAFPLWRNPGWPKEDVTVDGYVLWDILNHFWTHTIEKGKLKVMMKLSIRDKNNWWIYEGDILKTARGIEVVSWNKELARFEGLSGDEQEVIGTIFENPELIHNAQSPSNHK